VGSAWLATGLLLCSLAGCRGELTELVVVVDTDYAVPGALDEIVVVIEGPSGMAHTQTAALSGPDAPSLPLYVYVEPSGDTLGPVLVTATGSLGGADVIERQARTSFVRGESRMLFIRLLRSCATVSCADGESCAEAGCAPIDVPPASLPAWTGSPPPRDGGVEDAGLCEPVAESCNGLDDDCDGDVDEDFELTTDPSHCGACDVSCSDRPHSAGSCAAGVCTLTCDTGWDDCDGMVATGCEADLASPRSCGSCATACAAATPLCDPAMGCVSGCSPPTMRCGDTCVDTSADPLHCGDCDGACPEPAHGAPTCAGSTCGASCDSGWDDCDGMAGNGCEQQLNTTSHCGGCGVACTRAHATATCATGMCAIAACDAGWGNCDTAVVNGCEQTLTTLMHCAACGTPCAPANARGTCATGSCEVASCNPGSYDCDMNPATGCEGMRRMYYRDADSDGHGGTTMVVDATCTIPPGYVALGDDCDDTRDNVYPGAPELCNFLDDDCNTMPDDGLAMCGASCGNPWIVTDTVMTPIHSYCMNGNSLPIGDCEARTGGPYEVYLIQLTTSGRIELTVDSGEDYATIILQTECLGPVTVACQARASRWTSPLLTPGDYYLILADRRFNGVCPAGDVQVDVLYR